MRPGCRDVRRLGQRPPATRKVSNLPASACLVFWTTLISVSWCAPPDPSGFSCKKDSTPTTSDVHYECLFQAREKLCCSATTRFSGSGYAISGRLECPLSAKSSHSHIMHTPAYLLLTNVRFRPIADVRLLIAWTPSEWATRTPDLAVRPPQRTRLSAVGW